jgi:hypothetical protein
MHEQKSVLPDIQLSEESTDTVVLLLPRACASYQLTLRMKLRTGHYKLWD